MTVVDESYQHCRGLARAHGTTYFWATLLLDEDQRRHVWALYGFARHADDIVDRLDDAPVEARAAALERFGDRFFTGLAEGSSDDPVLSAVVQTVRALDIDPECFRRFLRSMMMDLTVTAYATWADLLDYMDGSAAVIGEMMLPVLRPTSPHALLPARQLGLAFQLTNFLRDVGEDLVRGRVYLPAEDLDRFGVDPRVRRVDDAWRGLMRFEIARCRRLYHAADSGLVMLSGRSGRCVRAARTLYAQILDRIERADYDVFAARARVPTWRKAVTVGVGLVCR